MIEFEILSHGLFAPNQLVISYDPSLRMPISPKTQVWMDTLWQQKLIQAKKQSTRLFDAPLFRFVEASVQDSTLHLVIGDTSYKEFVTTRTSEFAASRARHELGNGLSVCSVIETSDNFILLDRREGVDLYVGRYHVIGGFCERNLDRVSGHTPFDPFAAVQREIREETGIQSGDIREQYSLGIVYDLAMPHAEICFLTRLHIPFSEVQTRKPEDDEVKQLHMLQVTTESLQRFIVRHHDNLAATGEANLLLYGAWKFGTSWYEEVMTSIKESTVQ